MSHAHPCPVRWGATGILSLTVVVMLALAGSAQAATAVGLGTADSFAVLGGSGVTNTGLSVINGDLGTSPTPSVTGFGGTVDGTVIGAIHQADASAAQAQADLATAYKDAAGQGPAATLPTELGGRTLTPGVYDSASGTFGLTGALTLNGNGNPDAVFVLKTASTLISASASQVLLVNGAQSCNVFWKVGSSATLGTSSTFAGNVLALQSISLGSGVAVNGRLLARNGAVTLIDDTVTRADCATGGAGGGGGGSGGGVCHGVRLLAAPYLVIGIAGIVIDLSEPLSDRRICQPVNLRQPGAAASRAAAAGHCENAGLFGKRLKPRAAAKAIRCLIDEERRKRGLNSLDSQKTLKRAAKKHTKQMLSADCFLHTCPNEAELVGRVTSAGYLPCECSWSVGENIAWGQRKYGSPAAIIAAWMASPPHREMILMGSMRDVDVGFHTGKPGDRHAKAATYTADFGYRN